MELTQGLPSVIVPVLSKTIVSTFANCSTQLPSLIRIPFFAAFPIAAEKAAAVENLIPQTKSMTSILNARLILKVNK